MRRSSLAVFLALAATLVGPPAGWAGGPPEPGVPDKAMQKAIDAAVKRGAEWLKTKQNANGSYGGIFTKAGSHFEIGTTSLVTLALLAAGESRGDAQVDLAMTFLKGKDEARGRSGVRSTYDSGVLLMALTEYYRGKEKDPPAKGKPKSGGKGAKSPCGLPEDAARWVQDLTDALLASRKEAGTWGYPQHVEDLSNTQYAFLGLRAARDCGAAIPASVFEQAMTTLLARQEKDGPKVLRTIPAAGPGEKPYAIDSGDRARGWSYHQEPFIVTGSMTTAAIAVIAICHDALTRPERSAGYTSQMERDVQRSIQDGFSWLDKSWTVDRNPGAGAPNWHLYHLYGLERACVFGGRDLVGAHDWYLEGAAKLLSMQKEDGRWATGVMGGGKDYEANDLCDTAWAILFLKRATRPFPPIRAPVVTQGD